MSIMLHWMHTSEVNLLWIQCIHSSRCDIYTDVLWFYYESIKKNSFIYRFKTGANFSFCLLRIYVEKMISKNFWDLSNLIFYCNILCYSVNWIIRVSYSWRQICASDTKPFDINHLQYNFFTRTQLVVYTCN